MFELMFGRLNLYVVICLYNFGKNAEINSYQIVGIFPSTEQIFLI